MPNKTQEKTKRKAPPHAWKPGQSGNPAGCPTGSRHKTTLAIMSLLDGEAEALTRKCVEKAMEGDTTAIRLCLERIAPPRKDNPIQLSGIGQIDRASDLPVALGQVVKAVAAGDLTPSEGHSVAALLELQRKAFETSDLELRVVALEAAKKGGA